MKRLTYFLLVLVTLTTGCTKDFEKLSKNPNGIKDASAATLVSQTVYNAVVSRLRVSKAVGNELMGYTVGKSERAYVQRFDIRNTLGNDFWNRQYTLLTNIEDMYNLATKEGNPNYQAVALTLKAWAVSELTDTFRDIPYFEATKGDSLQFLPKFDTQEEIYDDILATLDRAALLFDNSKTMMASGDILYGNKTTTSLQITAWKKFCNSLRLRLYMRVSNVAKYNSPAKINEIARNPGTYPIFVNASDQAYLPFTNELPFYNPYYATTSGGFGGGVAPSTTIMEMLQDSADPRLSIYYTRGVAVWTPLQSGFPLGVGRDLWINGTSYMNYTLHNSPRLGLIMSYDEVQFILAEAAHKGWLTTGIAAKTYYDNAVKTNVEFWGITPSTNFLTHNRVDFNKTSNIDNNPNNDPDLDWQFKLERIMEQKYISNFFRGLEAWFDYRRTGFPRLDIDSRADNGAKVPSRLLYPVLTQRYNPINYQAAVARMGGDNINIKSFWEKP